MEDTIVAISTSLGVGAISIIRISGNESINIVNNIFKGKDLKKVKSHTINYGYIVENEVIIDEVLVSVMLTPKTFTKENVVEINCHGGIATTNKILELLLLNGCRLAEPGEFTKRAFLNGRIDLTQAEAVMDLINAKTEKIRDISISQLNGTVSNLIKQLRQEIIEVIANIEVNIDYPEYEDIEEVTNNNLIPKINKVKEKMEKIIKESENCQVFKEGIKTAIIGKPNVGKSSLLNILIDEEKAIVTDIEGTTRDIVEGSINLDGILLNIIDTAGIRKTNNYVEQIGVKKSLELIEQADLILFVLNNNEKISNDEKELLEQIKNKNHIVVINKCDLETNLDIELIKSKYIVKMSTLKNIGVNELKKYIVEIFNLEKIETKDLTYLTSARSIALIKEAYNNILEVEIGLSNNMPIDMIEIDIKNAWNLLGKIIGETYEDELINQLFSQFCLGK